MGFFTKIPRPNASTTFSFIKFVRFAFVFVAVGSILFKGYNIWQVSHSISPIIEAIGGRLFNPLYNLAEHLKNVSTTGLFLNTGHILLDVGNFFVNIYYFIEPIFFLYYSLFYIFLLSRHLIIMDKSRDFNAILNTVIIYFSIVFVYISAFTDLSLDAPFIAIKEIVNGIFNLF